jgi:hypothetical protein
MAVRGGKVYARGFGEGGRGGEEDCDGEDAAGGHGVSFYIDI